MVNLTFISLLLITPDCTKMPVIKRFYNKNALKKNNASFGNKTLKIRVQNFFRD